LATRRPYVEEAQEGLAQGQAQEATDIAAAAAASSSVVTCKAASETVELCPEGLPARISVIARHMLSRGCVCCTPAGWGGGVCV
jgi:hypothetical protein